MFKKILIITFLFNFTFAKCQNTDLYEKEIFVYENDTLNYRILKPNNYDPKKKYPLHLFLHGAGERGNDNQSQLVHGAKLFLKKENREKFNSWVIFPQCKTNDRWPSFKFDTWNAEPKYNSDDIEPNTSLKLVIKLMDGFVNKVQVDKNKVYVSGLSMGGMGTFEILSRRPEMFAAATPICGNGIEKLTEIYAKKVPIWIFHGSDDTVVSPSHSLKMANAIIKNGGSPRITFYENVGHDSWNNAFEEKDFLEWIHSKSKQQ